MACINFFNLRKSTPQYKDRIANDHKWHLTNNRGDNVFLLLLDLSLAFDTVNHSLLLSGLENSFGITRTVLQWFHS